MKEKLDETNKKIFNAIYSRSIWELEPLNCPHQTFNQQIGLGIFNEVTYLGFAVIRNAFEIVKYMLDQGANINQICNPYAETALHLAVRCGNKEAFNTLLDYSPSLEINSWNGTPLHVACIYHTNNRSYFVERLVEYGANIQAINAEGKTPYELALKYKRKEIIDFLSENSNIKTQKF